MRKSLIGFVAVLLVATAGYAFAQGGGMRGGMMSPGMMGMMNMMQECGRMMEGGTVAAATPVTKERAEAIVKQHLTNRRNPNLKVGKVTEETASFVVEVVTKEGSLVDKVIVDKRTGHLRSIYF